MKICEVKSNATGECYYVSRSLRGRCFYLVPKKNPAQEPFLAYRKDFTRPVEKEV